MGSTYDSLFDVSVPSRPNIELGLYDARLVGISTIYLEGGQFGEGKVVTDPATGVKVNRFRWLFGLLDDEGEPMYEDGDPIEIDIVTGLQFYAKSKNPSKQVRVMKALLSADEFDAWSEGQPAPQGKELIGRPAQVDVGENAKGYFTISNVLAPRKRRAVSR